MCPATPPALADRLTALSSQVLMEPAQLLGPNPSVDQLRAFAALRRSRALLRLARGLYVSTRPGRFGPCPPPVEAILASLSNRTGETIVSIGASAANRLRLSTQVPIRLVYWTSGPSRTLRLGKLAIELRHQPIAWLRQPGLHGEILRALEWMGASEAPRSVRLLVRQHPPAQWLPQALAVPHLPDWVRQALLAGQPQPT